MISKLNILVALLFSFASFANAKENTSRPNVIYILADDLGYGDLSCLGQEKFQTPNIDRIAREGMVFTNHYSGNTVCSPSRAVLLTGQDPAHVHCRGNAGENEMALDSAMTTLPRLFKNAGYATGCFGKWGLGTTNLKGNPNPLTHGFDTYYGPITQMAAHTYFNDEMVHDGAIVSVKKTDYSGSLIMNEAMAFIKESAGEPFFCYLPTPIPHASMHAPEALHNKWRKVFPEYDKQIGKYGAGPGVYCPDVINPIAGFAAMMENLDNEVGRMLALLQELGIDDETMIVFASDNGSHIEGGHQPEFWNSNGPFRGHKRDLYEGGIHTPMMVRWPAVVKPNTQSDHISGFWDVLPTMADILDLPIPTQTNGISMLPTLKGKQRKQAEHTSLYFEFTKGKKQVVVGQAFRKGDWKLVRQSQGSNKKKKELPLDQCPLELYNLSNDLGEQHDLSAQYPELVKELFDEMISTRKPIPSRP